MSLQNRFEAVPRPIENYWQPIMEHAKVSWERFRCETNRNHNKPHKEDVTAIRADVPDVYSEEDWNYILDRHFLKEEFKVNCQIINFIHH